MTAPANYLFVVERQPIELFALEFRPADDTAKQWFSGVWQRMATALEKSHKIAGTSPPDWVQWKPWDWCESKRTDYRHE